MTRSKRASHTRRSTPVRLVSRTYAHTPPSRPSGHGPRYQRHNLKQKYSPKSCGYEDDSEDTYLSFLRGIRDAENDDDDDNAGSDGTSPDTSSNDEEMDEEATLVEMLGSSTYREEEILQALRRTFADASHSLREDVIMSLGPVLRSIRATRPAPGRAFITGLLGFDDACKHFEESSYQNDELSAAYAKIEGDIIELFERLQAAYSRLEDKRAAFQKRVKEHTNKMREIIDELPADVDTLLARMGKKYDDRGMDEDSSGKGKGRERTVEGALAELQL